MDGDRRKKKIKYMSGQFSENEKRWPIADKEMAAVIKALDKLYALLVTEEFTLITDSLAVSGILKEIKKKNPLRCRFAWWTLVLKGYKYRVKHIKGKQNELADFLSREEAEQQNQEEAEL